MTNRSRAWRRRKARLIVGKIETTKNWLIKRFKDPNVKPGVVVKLHKAGKQTRAQDLRRSWQLQQEIADGMIG